jgi:Mg-chelatase subunit ChlD
MSFESDIIHKNIDEEKEKLIEGIRDYFEENRRFLEHYSGDSDFKIENGRDVGLDTFAVDLEKRVMYFDPKFWVDNGFEPEDAVFGTLHELEHLKELIECLEKPDGKWLWKRHRDRLKRSKAYQIMDNCYDDIKMNKSVTSNAPVMEDVPKRIYTEKLFQNKDFNKLPLHLQFSYSLIRNPMTGEDADVHIDVRKELEKLQNRELPDGRVVDLLEVFSSPETTMKDRIKFQENILKPILDKFLEKDKNNPEFNKSDKGSKEEKSKGGDSDESVQENEESEKIESSDEMFGEYYDEYDKNNPKPKEIDDEKLDEIIEKIIESGNNDKKSPKQRALEAYAKKEGVSKEELSSYRDFKKNEVDEVVDSETGNKAIDDIRETLKRIVNDRVSKKRLPKRPVDHGERLILPAEAFVAVKSMEIKPKVWETTETKEKELKKVDAFDLHIVADVSGSMAGEKLVEQRKAVAIVLESMQELYEELERLEPDVDYPLSIRTECLTFGSDVVKVKELGIGLNEKERVKMYRELGHAPGSTADYLALEEIDKRIDNQTQKELSEGKRKKLVIVTTDGQSDNPDRLKSAIKNLREKNTIVIGVGITQDGKVTTVNYNPDGFLADKAQDLPVIFKKVLDKYLESI